MLSALRQARAVACVAIASLALGIGANITVYSIVRELILDDVSATRPDRLVRLGASIPYDTFRQLQASGVFQDLAYNHGIGDSIWRNGAYGETVWVGRTSPNFFDVFGVRASAGRLYSPSDSGRDVAAVSYGFWVRRLHANPQAIGSSLNLNGRLYTIAGILPRDYRSTLGHGVVPEIYFPDIAPRQYSLFGRLHDGQTPEQARQALAAAAARIGGPDLARRLASLRPLGGLSGYAAQQGAERSFYLFFVTLYGVAGMLALIACSNVAGLLLVRMSGRRREIAIRKALGATRFQLLRHLLGEGALLVVAGAAAGLLLDRILRAQLSQVRWPSAYGIPIEFHFPNDSGLVLYACALAFAALMVTSLLPALRASDADLHLAMKQGEPAFSTRGWNLRTAFLGIQVVLSTALLTVGTLFLRGFLAVAAAHPGFDAAHLLVATAHGPASRPQVLANVSAIPGVLSATSIGTLPLMGELGESDVRRTSHPEETPARVYTMGAGDRFCETLSIPILRGRDFRLDDRTRTPRPALITRTLALQLFGEGDPIGQALERDGHVLEIVGVIGDVKMRTLGESFHAMLFEPDFNTQLLVRIAGPLAPAIEPLRRALEVPGATAIDIRPLSDAAAGAIFPMRIAAGFVGCLAALGLLLALLGLYAAVSYSVGRRTREFGIRVALGATSPSIVWTAVRDTVVLLLAACTAGLILASAAIRFLTAVLPDAVRPWSPATFLPVLLLFVTAGTAAAIVPARRAAKSDPAAALRDAG